MPSNGLLDLRGTDALLLPTGWQHLSDITAGKAGAPEGNDNAAKDKNNTPSGGVLNDPTKGRNAHPKSERERQRIRYRGLKDNPKAGREIAAKQTDWEADPEHGRKPGNPTGANQYSGGTLSDTDDSSRDQESARGIRRRLQKRANAGQRGRDPLRAGRRAQARWGNRRQKCRQF
jgi:hypothetical protein